MNPLSIQQPLMKLEQLLIQPKGMYTWLMMHIMQSLRKKPLRRDTHRSVYPNVQRPKDCHSNLKGSQIQPIPMVDAEKVMELTSLSNKLWMRTAHGNVPPKVQRVQSIGPSLMVAVEVVVEDVVVDAMVGALQEDVVGAEALAMATPRLKTIPSLLSGYNFLKKQKPSSRTAKLARQLSNFVRYMIPRCLMAKCR
jgi:hypothetical protein